MKQKITDAALVFGIATDISNEQRIMDVKSAYEQIKAEEQRQDQEQRESNANAQQEFLRAEQDRARHANEQRVVVETAVRNAAQEQRDEHWRIRQSLKQVQDPQQLNARQQSRSERIAAWEQLEVVDKLEMQRQQELEQIDKGLKPIHSAAHYSADAPATCIEGTCTEILSDVQTWALSEYGPVVYYLVGLAGTGKSTIASSLCSQLVAAGISVVSFFISHHRLGHNTLSSVVTTLAHQLARSSSVARGVICTALRKQPPIAVRSIAEQTQELLVHPLNAICAASAPSYWPMVIVIDAMDECDEFAAFEGRNLLKTLVPALSHWGHGVKLFLTSQEEPELQAMLDLVSDGVGLRLRIAPSRIMNPHSEIWRRRIAEPDTH
ncbi:hypothetical protein BKA62DRAFT_321010 [Auriculariales sp. MPI-PUGE-AT-0066]|nr:hypothetical protein BKA62DRAFT_321010 [Auriculariales sp. MPI-PUGE-AT-0066]